MVNENKTKKVMKQDTSKLIFGRIRKDYPTLLIDDAIFVAKKLKEVSGTGTIKPELLSKAIGVKGGWFIRRLTSAKRWGLIIGNKDLQLSDIGKKIFYFQSEKDPKKAKVDAFMRINLFKNVYLRYREGFPDKNVLANTLVIEYHVSEKDAPNIANIIMQSVNKLDLTDYIDHSEEQEDSVLESKEKGLEPIKNSDKNIIAEVSIKTLFGNNHFIIKDKESTLYFDVAITHLIKSWKEKFGINSKK